MWVLIIVGIAKVWWLTNYGYLTPETWKWLAPVGFLVIGLAVAVSCASCCKMGMHKMKSGHGGCGNGGCKCEHNGEMKKNCRCGGNGPCQCSPKANTNIENN